MTTPAMPTVAEHERQFAAEVDRAAQLPDGVARLLTLCDEQHVAYANESAPAIARMRGWVLEALGRRPPLADATVPYVLEELEAPSHPYLLAVAARCLRAARSPHASYAPAISHAFRVAPHFEAPVTLGAYGGLGGGPGTFSTSPIRELVATIEWLGPFAALLAEDIQDALRDGSVAPDLLLALEQLFAALPSDAPKECCSALPESIARFLRGAHLATARRRRRPQSCQARRPLSATCPPFRGLFRSGHPTVVAFFYTRCDNPFKCSLTISKLGRVQRLLHARGLGDSIRTVGITYDPEFDTLTQLSRYGHNRGLSLDARHVLVRATAGFDELRRHFDLGVSFFESLVSRHRIEVFVLDRKGRIASTFHRLNWSEEQVVDHAVALVEDDKAGRLGSMASLVGLAALAVPKCPLCWATYATVLGFSGTLAYPTPWALQVLAAALLLVYCTGMVWRARRTGWRLEHALAVVGGAVVTFNTFVVPAGAENALAVWVGAGLMVCASVFSVARRVPGGSLRRQLSVSGS